MGSGVYALAGSYASFLSLGLQHVGLGGIGESEQIRTNGRDIISAAVGSDSAATLRSVLLTLNGR